MTERQVAKAENLALTHNPDAFEHDPSPPPSDVADKTPAWEPNKMYIERPKKAAATKRSSKKSAAKKK